MKSNALKNLSEGFRWKVFRKHTTPGPPLWFVKGDQVKGGQVKGGRIEDSWMKSNVLDRFW
jgi:hypothetical protein